MDIKLFGLKWDLKPVFVFMWLSVALALFSGFLVYALDDRPVEAILCSLGVFLWAYITSTLEANGLLKP